MTGSRSLLTGFALACLVALPTGSTSAQDFTISPPAFPKDASGVVVTHFLPPADNFSANVNVIVQETDLSVEEYAKASRESFDEAKFKVLNSRVTASEVLFEYTGEFQKRQLHWFSRAVHTGGKVYVITATTLDARWNTDGPVLAKSVMSFKLK